MGNDLLSEDRASGSYFLDDPHAPISGGWRVDGPIPFSDFFHKRVDLVLHCATLYS